MQKDFKLDTWTTFHSCLKGKKLFLFGASSKGISVWKTIQKFESPWRVIAFLDNNSKKHGNFIDGLEILSPQILNQYQPDDYVVLICSVFTGAISKQLFQLHVKHYFALMWLDTNMHDYYEQNNFPDAQITKLLSCLADDSSRNLVLQLLEKRKNGFMDYTDIKSDGSEYFINQYFSHDSNEVFIDGGAYNGDTIEEFIAWTKNNYKKIYSFEPDQKCASLIKSKLYKYSRLLFFEAGLYSSNTQMPFCESNNHASSNISEINKGTYEISCVALDEIVKERVTFIKLDIEGAELEALKGAKKIIKRDRPKLAICIYHKLEDLWEIPLWLHNLEPSYQLYIRHYGIRCYGTILYAIPK